MTGNDPEWEEFKNTVKPLKPRDRADPGLTKPTPSPISRDQTMAERIISSKLGQSVFAAMSKKQQSNLVSHIYKLLGIGKPPIPGGKIEGKKRSKLW